MSRLSDLLDLCRGRPGLDALGVALIDSAMATLMESLEGKVRGARVLRGLVHLRPGGGYAGLLVHPATDDATLTTSATAWRAIEERQGPVLIDIKRAELRGPGEAAQPNPGGSLLSSLAAGDAFKSRVAMLQREVTHLVALPLVDAGGALFGMLCLELCALAAVGRPLPWEPAVPELVQLATLAGPWLAALPLHDAPPRAHEDPLLPVVGRQMASLMGLLRIFASQDETVLISGPTGAGKSRLARWCHARSSRAGGPFEAIDLLTIPDDMQQGELFGWRKGAFTGAAANHDGAVARAEGGTLFLDEIDKLSMRAQAALLQLIEERRYRPLGAAGAALAANVRFLVGTNADLRARVAEGKFREDLYYRVNVLPVRLPGLRERTDEIPAWAAFMLARRHAEAQVPGSARIDPVAAAMLAARPWEGNLRQLDNAVRRAWMVALADGAGAELVIAPRHVERALLLEQGPGGPSPLLAMGDAATALASAAIARAQEGAPIDLDLCAAFEGLALAAAEQLLGSRDAAFRAFGRDAMVTARNHHKSWRRSAARVRDLCLALGVATPLAFQDRDGEG